MDYNKLVMAGINIETGLDRFSQDKEIFEEFLTKFLDDQNYQILLQAIEKKDVKTAFLAAHSLKGISGNLSMYRLYAAVCNLVEALRKGKLTNVETLLLPVSEAYETLVEIIKTESSAS
jgi:HPt (histidine-containing phosphotransfer) domain-containing protein